MALMASVASSEQETRRGALEAALPHALDELAAAGTLVSQTGLVFADGLEVEVVQSAGEAWERESVAAAIDEHPAFRNGNSPHLIRVETVRARNAHALQLRLSRRGWDVMLPAPVQRRAQAYWFTLAVLLGAAFGWRTRRASWGALVAGLGSVLLLLVDAIAPPVLGYPSLSHELAAAPLWTELTHLVAQFERYLTAAVAGVIVFCALLVYFDHRRSKDGPNNLPAPRVLFDALALTVAAVLLIESAGRSGWSAGLGRPWGSVGALALLGACVVARIGAKQPRDAP